jgi:acetyl esterase/lipase
MEKTMNHRVIAPLAIVLACILATACDTGGSSDTPLPAQHLANLPYGTDPLQVLDADIPEGGGGGRGVLIMIHGGSWISGDKDNFMSFPSTISEEGYVVVNMNYRLANGDNPQANAIHIDDMIADVESVKAFISTKEKEWDCDADKVALLGFSAGGHLALLDTLRTVSDGKVKACVSLSGPTDFTDSAFQNTVAISDDPATQANEQKLVLEGLELVVGATGAASDPATVALLRAASPLPLCADLAGTGRLTGMEFVIVNGSADSLVPPAQAALMADALTVAGATTARYESDGEGHALSYMTYSHVLNAYLYPALGRAL